MKVDSVIKTFYDRALLQDIFLSCNKGEIIGLLGSNGVGKSTLLKIIFGSLSAEQKHITVKGKLIKNVFDNNGVIKYLPQFTFIPNHIKIKHIIDKFSDKKKSLFLSNHALLKPFLSSKSGSLSSGERRIIEVLLIIYSDSHFILLDEPFKNVDPKHVDELKKCIVKESENKGIILTDHNYKDILEIATRTVLLHDGSIKEIKTDNDLKFYRYIK